MRITFVTETYPPEINGVALTVARNVEFLRGAGHAVDLIRPRQVGESRGSEGSEWRAAGFPIPAYPELRFGYASQRALVARMAATGAQLVHVATQGPLGWKALGAARRLGLPVTSDFRTNFHQYSRYYRLGWTEPAINAYLRAFHNRTRISFAPTQQTRRDLLAAGIERVEVVGRGVDVERFSPAKRDVALRLRLNPDGGPILLHVGRLAPEKNIRLAFRAYRFARRFVPSTRLVVIGDGPSRPALEQEFPDARFTGVLTGEALAAHYACADLFLFPSLSDTFGNVTLEALASGVPVVAFDAAAASEHVRDRIGGRIVPPGDDEAFVIAASLLTLQFRGLEPMRLAAREAACEADWEQVLRRFEQQLVDMVYAHEQSGTPATCPA